MNRMNRMIAPIMAMVNRSYGSSPPTHAVLSDIPSAETRPPEMPTPRWLTHALEKDTPWSEGVDMVVRDGVDHINIGGRTELGRLLSHFAYSPFKHPVYGPFNSMEGLWHYIKGRKPDDALRSMAGWRAKQYSKKLPSRKLDNFKELIIDANYYKIEQNPYIKELLMQSTLPFDHYYLFGESNLLIRPKGFDWMVEGFEDLRRLFKEGKSPTPIAYPDLFGNH